MIAVRPARREDAAAIAAIGNADAAAVGADPELNEEETAHWFDLPDYEAWVAELDGEPVAFADLGVDVDGGRAWIDLRQARDGAADALLDVVEPRARERLPGARLRVLEPAGSSLGDVLAVRGYAVVRDGCRMTAPLADEPDEPRWPDGVAVRTAREGEEEAIHAAFEASFHDHWEHSHTPFEEFRAHHADGAGFDRSLWFVAEDAEGIAGISLCRRHPSGDPGIGFVSILGVLPRARRRGLGLALLLHSFAEFRRRGMHTAQLGVDAESTTGALELYERAGMHVLRRTHIWDRT